MTGASPSGDELEALMEAYQAGDLSAFERIFAALALPLRNYLISLARDRSRGDDLLQETFLQMHRSRHTYLPGRPLRPWAFGIARHVWLMNRRSRTRRARHEAPPRDRLPEIPVDGLAELVPDRRDLSRALLEVPEARREPMLLHHVWGFSFREVRVDSGRDSAAARRRAAPVRPA